MFTTPLTNQKSFFVVLKNGSILSGFRNLYEALCDKDSLDDRVRLDSRIVEGPYAEGWISCRLVQGKTSEDDRVEVTLCADHYRDLIHMSAPGHGNSYVHVC